MFLPAQGFQACCYSLRQTCQKLLGRRPPRRSRRLLDQLSLNPSTASAVSAAKQAANAALDALGGPPAAALFFDCVATRLRMGDEFGLELSSLQERFSEVPLTGCNTHGQIARAEGQFSGFHNCTAVVCVFPE
ncbi:FIST C-terminal domain-containing protein [Bradyrhizobium sp. 144]|nr:FIST C-terminal domain-containing protein [Bradyrhizobium sp. 144]